MSTLQDRFDATNANLDEASSEILAEIQTLKDELANTQLTPEAEASLEALEGKATDLANIANAPVPPPENTPPA